MKYYPFLSCLCFFLLITTITNAQKRKAFEGKIVYENKFESNVSGMSNEMLGSMLGTTWDYFITSDRYKFEMNGMHIQKQFYNPEEFKLYTKFVSSDTMAWIDVREWNTEIISHELIKTEEVILGHKCNALVLTTNKGKETYYFNRHIKADAELFKKHKFLNMAFVLNYTESIPLKIILESNEMNLESTATDIEPLSFESGAFAIPNLPSKPSSF